MPASSGKTAKNPGFLVRCPRLHRGAFRHPATNPVPYGPPEAAPLYFAAQKAGSSFSGRSTDKLRHYLSMRLFRNLRRAIGWPPQLAAALAIVLTASQAGCVERRMIVRTNPPGALLYVDDYEIGTTPCATSFIYYGTRKIRLVKDGYETLVVNQPLPAPWYEYFPADFVAENLVPGHIRDLRVLTYDLRPAIPVPNDQLRGRADALRDAVKAEQLSEGIVPKPRAVQPAPQLIPQPVGPQNVLPSPTYYPQPLPPNYSVPATPNYAAPAYNLPPNSPIYASPSGAPAYTIPPPGAQSYTIPPAGTPNLAPPAQ